MKLKQDTHSVGVEADGTAVVKYQVTKGKYTFIFSVLKISNLWKSSFMNYLKNIRTF